MLKFIAFWAQMWPSDNNNAFLSTRIMKSATSLDTNLKMNYDQ